MRLNNAISAIDSQLGGPFHRKGKKEGKYYSRNEEVINKGNGKGQHSAKGTEMAIEDLWGHHHDVSIGQRKSILDGIRERALNRGVIPQEDEADNEEVIDITLIEEGE